jgi:hypothetical protein
MSCISSSVDGWELQAPRAKRKTTKKYGTRIFLSKIRKNCQSNYPQNYLKVYGQKSTIIAEKRNFYGSPFELNLAFNSKSIGTNLKKSR